eukprot:gene21315-60557_t
MRSASAAEYWLLVSTPLSSGFVTSNFFKQCFEPKGMEVTKPLLKGVLTSNQYSAADADLITGNKNGWKIIREHTSTTLRKTFNKKLKKLRERIKGDDDDERPDGCSE